MTPKMTDNTDVYRGLLAAAVTAFPVQVNCCRVMLPVLLAD
jgi:hypothetical protein